MIEDRHLTATFNLVTDEASAMKWLNDGLIGSAKFSKLVDMQVEIKGSARAIYVSRPSERIVMQTGPCGEPGCDGNHVVGHLPMEHDHMPDAWEPMMFDIRVNGQSIERSNLERILEGCVPPDRVKQVRELVAKIDAKTTHAKDGLWSRL